MNPANVIESRIDILRNVSRRQGWVAEYVYESEDERLQNRPDLRLIFLPDYISLLRRVAFPNMTAEQQAAQGGEFTFALAWGLLSNISYYRITDGEPLDILEVAKVWLADQIHSVGTPLGRELARQTDRVARFVAIKKRIAEMITPVIQNEVTTDIGFTIKDLINAASRFPRDIISALQAQTLSLQALQAVQRELGNLESQPAYDNNLNYAIYGMQIARLDSNTALSYEPTLELDLWDGLIVDAVMPVCILNADEDKTGKNKFVSVDKRYFKVHAPSKEALLSYEANKWIDAAQSFTIIMYVYTGENEDNAADAPAKDFVQVSYSFKRGTEMFNQIQVYVTDADIGLIKQRINARWKNFRILSLANADEELMEVRESFVVPAIIIDKDIVMDMIGSSVALSTLLRFKEDEKTWSQKKNLKYSVFLLGHMELQITPKTNKSHVMLVEDNGILRSLWENEQYIKVKVTGRNRTQIALGRHIVLRLLTKYIEDYDDNHAFYDELFPMRPEQKDSSGRVVDKGFPGVKYVEPVVEEVRNRQNRFDPDAPVIKQLQQANPYLWNKDANYTRKGAPSKELQVMPIGEDQIEHFRSLGRQVIKWPVLLVDMKNVPLADQYQARCLVNPTPDHPCIQQYYTTATVQDGTGKKKQLRNIILVRNEGPNFEQYPFIPKCMEGGSGLVVMPNWNLYFAGIEKGQKNNERLNKTLRILAPGQRRGIQGSIPAFIGFSKVEAIGVRRSPASMLHCLLYATSDSSGFRGYYNTEAADDDVRRIRESLANYAPMCMQENPGKTVAEIAAAIRNHDIFLDPAKYYRAAEELFELNIFVLKALDTKNKIPVFEPPQYIEPYIRTRSRYRDAVILFKTTPKKQSRSSLPQCDILVGIDTENNASGELFTGVTLDRLENLRHKITQSITIGHKTSIVMSDDSGPYLEQETDVEVSSQRIRFLSTAILEKAIGQDVDRRGKLRGLVLDVDGIKISIVTEPIEPINKPLMELVANPVGYFDILLNLLNLQQDTIIDVAWTPDKEFVDTCAGVHLTVNNIRMFMPFIAHETPWRVDFEPIRIRNPFAELQQASYTQILLANERRITIYIQLIKRLYVMSDLSPEEFVDNYMVQVDSREMLALDVPNTSRMIPLPAMRDFDSLLTHFQRAFPTFFRDEAIVYDEERLKKNILLRLQRFEALRLGFATNPNIKVAAPSSNKFDDFPKYLEDFYMSADDFTVHTHQQLVTMSRDRFKIALKVSENAEPEFTTFITNAHTIQTDPFFYLHNNEQLFLVQNCLRGEFQRAAIIAIHWYRVKINLGFYAAIVGADTSNIHVANLSAKEPQFDFEHPMVGRYGNGEFAALLPITVKN